MKIRLLLCIAMGLFTAHLGVFMLMHPTRNAARGPLPAKPNFSAKATTVVDTETGERTTFREITVSTKLTPGCATPPPEKPPFSGSAVAAENNEPRF